MCSESRATKKRDDNPGARRYFIFFSICHALGACLMNEKEREEEKKKYT